MSPECEPPAPPVSPVRFSFSRGAVAPFSSMTRFPQFVCVFVACAFTVGCDEPEPPGQYHQSRGHIIEVPVKHVEDRVSITTFVRLKDGTVQLPIPYYLQKHHTSIGVRDVEKRGNVSLVAAPYRKSIKLPTSSDVEEYQFLTAGPSLVPDVEAGKETIVTRWTPTGLHIVSASEIEPGRVLPIPTLAVAEGEAVRQRQLFDKLFKMLDDYRRAEEVRGSIPVTSRTKLPWWAKE